MNSNLYRKMAQLNANLVNSGTDAQLANMLCNLLQDLDDANNQMLSLSRRVVDAASKAQDAVLNGMNVNGLGVLQGSALDLDRMAALRQDRYSSLVRMAKCMSVDLDLCLAVLADNVADLDDVVGA